MLLFPRVELLESACYRVEFSKRNYIIKDKASKSVVVMMLEESQDFTAALNDGKDIDDICRELF